MTYAFKTEPFAHQREVFESSRDLKSFAIFWEQGTGKTKLAIDCASADYLDKKIDAILVVAPPGVERNWISDELPVHMPDAVRAEAMISLYQTKKAGTKYHKFELERLLKHKGVAVLCVSYNAFTTDKAKKFIWRFLQRRRVFYILDEAHSIKTPSAKRTISIVASGVYAEKRRILTGTSVPEGPFDAYSQIRFLDENFWKRANLGTAAEFRQHFGVWRTAEDVKREKGYDPGYDQLVDYKNLDQLQAMLKSLSSRVLKEDVLDLPPKVFSKRYFEMTDEQRRLYEELKEDYITTLGDKTISAELAIVRLLRFQQIVCGYVQTDLDEPRTLLPSGNPRLGLMEDLRDAIPEQTIVWARFREDINQLEDMLGKDKVARYDGALSDDECEQNKFAFQRGDKQWFVATQAKGKEGLTLNMAHHVVYYSNTFRFLDRSQTEDRAHRAGLKHSVDYIDLICLGSVDEHIVSALRSKMDIFTKITGDKLREWI